MRLRKGCLWPMPITLDLPEATLRHLGHSDQLTLMDIDGTPLAVMTVSEVWRPDRRAEAEAVFGTTDFNHPGVEDLLSNTNPWYVSGPLKILASPAHHDFHQLRHTPAQLRAEFTRRG